MSQCILDHLGPCLAVTPLGVTLMTCDPGLAGGGGLLICGPRGVGKSTLARGVCRKLAAFPTLAHVQVVDCKPLRGKKNFF